MKASTYDTDADGKESFVSAEPCWGCTHDSGVFESSEAAHRWMLQLHFPGFASV
jgi:hypothetical protein